LKHAYLVNKFVFAIVGIVIVMAVLIAMPNISRQPSDNDIAIEYARQHQTKTEGGQEKGLIVTTQLDTLNIDKEGAATLTITDPRQNNIQVPKHFTLNGQQFARIKGLILDTGFMDVPKTDYPQSQNASNSFISYTLSIQTTNRQKTISWVEPDAYAGSIPPIITNIGTQLDGVIATAG
jgi:hypothetical protein